MRSDPLETLSLRAGVRTLLALPAFAPLCKLTGTLAQWARHRPASGHLQAKPRPRHPVALVGAGPGVADLITLRGVQRLQLAEVIFYDRLVDPDLLALANPKADCILVGKAPGHHSWTQAQINRALVQAANAGKRVLRLKCGDPGIFARGGEEATALAAAGLAYEIIPGVTAANACAAHAGLFLTERGVVDTLVLTTATGQDHGLAPDWTQYLHRGARIAIYMGIHTAPRISDEITKSTYAREIEATIVSKLGQPDARSLTCRGQDLAAVIKANDISNPAVIFLTLPKSAPLSTARQFKAYGAPVGPG